jgi:hypothetical protein
MMLRQDGSTHEWVPGCQWDLIVTLDDATTAIYSTFFVEKEGTMSSLQGLREVIEAQGLFSSLYTDRGTHYFHYVKVTVRLHAYPDGTRTVFHGPRCLVRYHADGRLIDTGTPTQAQPVGRTSGRSTLRNQLCTKYFQHVAEPSSEKTGPDRSCATSTKQINLLSTAGDGPQDISLGFDRILTADKRFISQSRSGGSLSPLTG